MTRSTLLSATTLAGLAFLGVTNDARACTLNALTLTCTGVNSQQSSALSNLDVLIQSGASVLRATSAGNGAALGLSGNNVTVGNSGSIINERTTNNDANAAIQGTGSNLTVTNSGTISSGDRAIHITGGTGGFTLTNEATGTITSRRQAVRTLNDLALPNSTVTNYGSITSTTDRAVQLRGPGAKVYNYGSMAGGDEVIEAREDFYLENTGTIIADAASTDADGVQYASGSVYNHGTISGTDDGIDVDEGYIFNGVKGAIRARANGAGNGIDIDPLYEPSDASKTRPSGDLTIENAGLIEGPSAIGSDAAAQNKVTVLNSGTLSGNSGTAIALAPGQGDSLVENSGGGRILGDVLFGAGDDLFRLAGLTGAAAVDGIVDGGEGENIVSLLYSLHDIVSFVATDTTAELTLRIAGGTLFSASFANFDTWMLGDSRHYSTAELSDALAPVPLPAGLPLLLGGIAAMALLRRRPSPRA